MSKLFDLPLFHTSLTLNGASCKVIVQFTILVDVNRYIRCVVAKKDDTVPSQEKYFILQIDNSQKIVPMHPKYLDVICSTISHIQFPANYCLDLALNYTNVTSIKGISPLALSSNVTAILGNSKDLLQYQKIALKLGNLEEQLSLFNNFVFYAYDGAKTHLDISVALSDFSKHRNWHTLSGFVLLIEGTAQEEFFPIDIHIIEDYVHLHCQTELYHTLSSAKIGKSKVDNLNIYETMDFFVSCAGFRNAVVFPDGYTPSVVWYTVAIPVWGISVTKEIGIGATLYYPKGHNELERFIDFDPSWAQYSTVALVQINATSMYEAYIKGKKQIEQSLDFAINLIKDDSVYSFHSLGSHANNRTVDHHQAKVEIAPFAYIEAPLFEKRISIEFVKAEQQALPIPESFPFTLADNQKIEMLMIKAEGKTDKNISPLLNSLKWVRKAWDSDDIEDQIIFAVTALEFIVSTEKGGVPLINKPLRDSVNASIKEIIIKEYIGTDLDAYVSRVEDKFLHMCTDIPFMQKLRNLIDRLSIPVSEAEFELLHKLRQYRNKIIHGKNLDEITISKVKLICQIISTIAFHKLNSIPLK